MLSGCRSAAGRILPQYPQNRHIFILSAPVAPQVDAVHIDVRILAALQRTVAPILNMDIRLLVQLADRGRRHLAAPQSLGNVFHTTYGYTCQIHLDEGFLHAAFPAAIALDDGGLERDALETGHMQRHVAGGRGKVPVIVPASVALAGLIALVASSLGQFLCFLLQKLVQRLFYAPSDQFFDLPLDNFLVELYNLLRHSLLAPF